MVPGPGSSVPSTAEISAPPHMPCAMTFWNMSDLAKSSSTWAGLTSPDMTANSSMSWRCSVRVTSALSPTASRSEEHTSELQVTNAHLVCRLLLEKKNKK